MSEPISERFPAWVAREIINGGAVNLPFSRTDLLPICNSSSRYNGTQIYIHHPANFPKKWMTFDGEMSDITFERSKYYGWQLVRIESQLFLVPPDILKKPDVPASTNDAEFFNPLSSFDDLHAEAQRLILEIKTILRSPPGFDEFKKSEFKRMAELRKRAEKLKQLMSSTADHDDAKSFLQQLKQSGLKIRWVLFKNLTDPWDGERRSPADLHAWMQRHLKDNLVMTVNIKLLRVWEKELSDYCRARDWKTADRRGQSKYSFSGIIRRRKFMELLNKTNLRNITPEQFLELLRNRGINDVALVFENLINPKSGRRMAPRQIVLDPRVDMKEHAVRHWEEDILIPICDKQGWEYVKRTDAALAVEMGVRRAEIYRRLAEQAEPGASGLSNFYDQLRRNGLVARLIILINMIEPQGDKRRPVTDLISEMRLSEATARRIECEIETLAREKQWPIVERSEQSQLAQSGHERKAKFWTLLNHAESGRRGIKKFLKILENNDLSDMAIALRNYTIPDEGIRINFRQLAKDRRIGVNAHTIYEWEKEFADICKEMDWPVADVSRQTEISTQGQNKRKIFHQLLKDADKGVEGLRAFLNMLRQGGLHNYAAILENRTIPKGGKKVSGRELAKRPDVTLSATNISKRDRQLIPICQEKDWPIAWGPREKRPSEVILSSDPFLLHTLWNLFKDIFTGFKEYKTRKPAFAEELIALRRRNNLSPETIFRQFSSHKTSVFNQRVIRRGLIETGKRARSGLFSGLSRARDILRRVRHLERKR